MANIDRDAVYEDISSQPEEQRLREASEEVNGPDPYCQIFRADVTKCTLKDHQSSGRSKASPNCCDNPWCHFGLGEQGRGIYAPSPEMYAKLGPDPSNTDRLKLLGCVLTPFCL